MGVARSGSAGVDRSAGSVLGAATRVLVERPSASLAEVAEAVGVGRTTLHRMFPTRRDLFVAIAQDAVRRLAGVYAEAGLVIRDDAAQSQPGATVDRARMRARTPSRGGTPGQPAGEGLGGLRHLIDLMIPLGPSLMFLLRAPELDGDEDLSAQVDELDRPVRDAVRRGQLTGSVNPQIPDWWAVELLFAGIYIAWEQIEVGRLAPLDAADLVYRTWRTGVGPAPDAGRQTSGPRSEN